MLVGVLLSIVPATTAFLAQPLAAGSGHAAALVQRRAIAPAMLDIDSSYLLGGGALFVGLGGGIGLIALTENAGKRNEEADNAQPCVVCKGERVVKCPVCDGTGADQFASYVAGVQEMAGEKGDSMAEPTVTVDDWDEGPKQVVMFKEILSKYPVKATENVCVNCDGRGVIVCDNCQGSGFQPRFLERYSPDDFMD